MSTVTVNADECSESTVDSVAAQLQAKGWVVEVLPADGADPAQLVISQPAVANPATAEPAQPSLRRPAVEPASEHRPSFAEQMAADNLRKWTELEQAERAGASSEVTITASKRAIVVWAMIGVMVLGAFVAVWVLYISPRRQLDQLAKDTCDDLDGSIMLVVGATLSSAVNKAERLGFSGPELGDRMREHCPSIMRQIQDFASRY